MLAAMTVLSAQYPRYSHRRIQVLLERQGLPMSADRAYRLWSGAGLQVLRKRPRGRIAASRARPAKPEAANQVWTYDFVFDDRANGPQLEGLTVMDEYTRESSAIDVTVSISSARVIKVLSQLISIRGAPRVLQPDNGPENCCAGLPSKAWTWH